jgi:hypothetical protein
MKKLNSKIGIKNKLNQQSFKIEYERALTECEQNILKKDITETKTEYPKKLSNLILLTIMIISFNILVSFYPKIWLIIILCITSFVTFLYLYFEISDLITSPKFIKEKQKVIDNGIVRINEISIDRYIKINNLESEENHFVIEYKKKLTLIGGHEFLDVKKLKNKVQLITILDSKKTTVYYNNVKTSGENLNSYYTFRNGISKKLSKSEIWFNLTNNKPYLGKLEDFNQFIEDDKRS